MNKRECGQCLEWRFTMPVRFNCLGHRFTEQMCLDCRLQLNMNDLDANYANLERHDGRALLPRRQMTSPAATQTAGDPA